MDLISGLILISIFELLSMFGLVLMSVFDLILMSEFDLISVLML